MMTAVFTVATLIGVYVTPNQIVVGADTAVLNADGSPFNPGVVARKYCITGPGSVSTIQGQYGLTSTSGSVAYLHTVFMNKCSEIKDMPLSLQGKIDRTAESLRDSVAKLGNGIFPQTVAGSAPRDITTVMIAGYENSKPVVLVRQIMARKTSTGAWEAFTQVAQGAEQCVGRFIGEATVVKAFQNNPTRFPSVDTKKIENSILLGRGGNCATWTYAQIRASFVAAVNLTVKFGPYYGLKNGLVAPPLEIVRISKSGLQTEVIPKLP